MKTERISPPNPTTLRQFIKNDSAICKIEKLPGGQKRLNVSGEKKGGRIDGSFNLFDEGTPQGISEIMFENVQFEHLKIFPTTGNHGTPSLFFRDCVFSSILIGEKSSDENEYKMSGPVRFWGCDFLLKNAPKDQGVDRSSGVANCRFSKPLEFNRCTFSGEKEFRIENCSFGSERSEEDGLSDNSAPIAFWNCHFENRSASGIGIVISNSDFFAPPENPSFVFFQSKAAGDVRISGGRFHGDCDFSLSSFGSLLTKRMHVSGLLDFRKSSVSEMLRLDLISYRNMTFGLYDASIQKFSCDDPDFYHSAIMSSERYLREKSKWGRLKTLKDTPIWEHSGIPGAQSELFYRLNEIRVLNDIFERAKMRSEEEVAYCEIMETITRLEGIGRSDSSSMNNFARKTVSVTKLLVYGKIFGWGVKFSNILFSSSVIISAYSFAYLCVPTSEKLRAIFASTPAKLSIIDGLSLSVTSFFGLLLPEKEVAPIGGMLYILSGSEKVLGTIILTVLVATLSRKFMKM